MWAVRPLVLSKQDEHMTLVLEDPGGETLDRFLVRRIEARNPRALLHKGKNHIDYRCFHPG